MCRLAAYLGAPRELATLLYDPPHSLERQAYLPREMVSGHVNVDGTGVAWWRDGDPRPLRYVTEQPPWSDPNLPSLASRLTGSPIVAVVRSQTPGMPAGAGAVHPFVDGGWAGAHNGYLRRFHEFRFDLIGHLDEAGRQKLETITDAAVLVQIALTAIRRGETPPRALVSAARLAAERCAAVDAAASLNLVLASTDRVVALRAARGVASNSLYLLETAGRWPDGIVLASEALDDDPAWSEVPDAHVVEMSADGVRMEAVEV